MGNLSNILENYKSSLTQSAVDVTKLLNDGAEFSASSWETILGEKANKGPGTEPLPTFTDDF